MAAGAIDHVERSGIRQLMRFGNLPRIGVIEIFLHRMHSYGHHIGPLLARLLGLGDRLLNIAVVMRVAAFAQPIDLPVLIGGHAVERHGSGDETQLAATRRRCEHQRLKRVRLGLIRSRLRYAIGLQRVPQAGDALRPLVPGMVGGMSARLIADMLGGIGHFGRNIENRIRTVRAAALRDGRLELADGDVGRLDVLLHRLEQRVEVECGAVRRRGVGPGEMLPQPFVEQQIAIDQHGDAVRVRAIRRIAVMLRNGCCGIGIRRRRCGFRRIR